jgi:hypothetical protein
LLFRRERTLLIVGHIEHGRNHDHDCQRVDDGTHV